MQSAARPRRQWRMIRMMSKKEKQIATRVDSQTYAAILRYQTIKSLQVGESLSVAMTVRILLRESLLDSLERINLPRPNRVATDTPRPLPLIE